MDIRSKALYSKIGMVIRIQLTETFLYYLQVQTPVSKPRK